MGIFLFFYSGATAPGGPRPPHYRGFTITLRLITLGRTPLDEWSAWRRGLYLTTHSTNKRQTFMIPASFEPAIPASERPQNHAWDRAATRISIMGIRNFNLLRSQVRKLGQIGLTVLNIHTVPSPTLTPIFLIYPFELSSQNKTILR
jgi:hypothetical protein